MATRTKTEVRLAIIADTTTGPRAQWTAPVTANTDLVEVTARAEGIAACLAEKLGCPTRVTTFTHTV